MAPHARLVGPLPDGVDPLEYDALRRRVLWSMPSGLYLLGTRDGTRRNFMTANLVVQLATDPKLVGVSVERDALSAELVCGGRSFVLALLRRADRALVRKFVKPSVHDESAGTLNGYPYRDAPVSGAPIPAQAAAYIDCSLFREVDLGSHLLMIGEVLDAGFPLGEPEAIEFLRSEDTRMNYGG